MSTSTGPRRSTCSRERASRGCRQVVSVEMDRDHHRFISECVKKLGAPIIPIRGDVFRFIKSCRQQYDLIFADPPYALEQLPQIPDLVIGRQLLKDGGIFVFEHGKDHDFTQHPNFMEHRQYGSVNFTLFRI